MGTILLIIVLAVAAYFILAYNSLVKLRYRVNEAFADIEVQLKRRHDLIPNLVEAVKGYMEHEKEVFEKVTEARTAALSAGTVNLAARAKAEDALTGTLKSLFAVSENYPQLKANENFLQLQGELTDTENKIQAARRFYNTVVMDYNTKIDSFPTNLYAGTLHFEKKDFFEVEDESEKAPVQVKF